MMMFGRSVTARCLAAACFAASLTHLAGCSSADVGVEPAIGSVDPIKDSKLQFAVGVATINETSQNQVVSVFNTVETIRQPNGLSAVLFDTPYITGPQGFSGQPDPITGQQTTIISGSGPNIPCNKTVFACTGGAFGYGFAPDNTVPNQQAPSFLEFSQPIAVGAQDQLQSVPYYGGPPTFPVFNNGTYPAGFSGFSAGFNTFQTAPVLGLYTLDVVIPIGQGAFGKKTTTAMLTSLTPLPAMAAPSAFPDPANPGGLKIDIVVPAGVTETWVWIQDGGGCYPHTQGNSSNNQFYTVRTTQTGAQQLTVPPNLGPTNGSGSTPTICSALQNQQATGNPNATGDTYSVYAAGFDYPAFGAAYPFNQQQTPSFIGANGQVDVTLTQPVSFVYP
jgi:hypothetical protein